MSATDHGYYVLAASKDKKFSAIRERPTELDEFNWKLAEGQRVVDVYPATLSMRFSDKEPGVLAPDNLRNNFRNWLISSRLKQLLEKNCSDDIEYLPFTLLDHKGRTVAEPYFIANVLGTEDCVDLSRTVAVWSKVEPDKFSRFTKLYIDEKKVGQSKKIFRIKQRPHVLIVRDDLRRVFDEAGVTGAAYIAMGEECEL